MRGWLSLSSLAADTMLFTVWQNHPFIRGGSSCAVVQRERRAALSSVSLQLMNTTRRWHLFPNLNVFLIDLLIRWSRRMPVIHICVFCKERTFCSDLSPLGPERRVQLAVGKQAVLQAGQELEQVASSGEAKRRSLYPVLTDQHHCPPTVNWREMISFFNHWRWCFIDGCV